MKHNIEEYWSTFSLLLEYIWENVQYFYLFIPTYRDRVDVRFGAGYMNSCYTYAGNNIMYYGINLGTS